MNKQNEGLIAMITAYDEKNMVVEEVKHEKDGTWSVRVAFPPKIKPVESKT